LLNWTAYDGLSKGKADIDVKVLPSVLLTFSSGELHVEKALTLNAHGFAIWTLYSDGNQTFVPWQGRDRRLLSELRTRTLK
jgi:hypothetical protein